MSRSKLVFLLLVLTFCGLTPAYTHIPFVIRPVRLHRLLLPIRLPGLSGAQNALLQRNRLITSTGINLGINQTVQQAYQGQIFVGATDR